MSLYSTLPRRNRSFSKQTASSSSSGSAGTGAVGADGSGSLGGAIYFQPRPQHYRSQQQLTVFGRDSPGGPSTRPVNHYATPAVEDGGGFSTIRVQLNHSSKPSLINFSSGIYAATENFYPFPISLAASPMTENSDTITFTDSSNSSASTFGDDSISTITIPPKIYYASDSFHRKQRFYGRSYYQKKNKPPARPNFYGIDEDEDDDDDPENDYDDNLVGGYKDNDSDEYRFNLSDDVDEHYYHTPAAVLDPHRRNRPPPLSLQSPPVPPTIISSKALPVGVATTTFTSSSIRFRSRRNVRYLSLRIRKLYRSTANSRLFSSNTKLPTTTTSPCSNPPAISPTSRLSGYIETKFQKLKRNLKPPSSATAAAAAAFVRPAFGSRVWKDKIVFVLNKALQRNGDAASKDDTDLACNTKPTNATTKTMSTSTSLPSIMTATAATAVNNQQQDDETVVDDDLVSDNFESSKGDCWAMNGQQISTKTTTKLTSENNGSSSNIAYSQHSDSLSIHSKNRHNHLRCSSHSYKSLAGIKKRPLSQIYDLVRINQQSIQQLQQQQQSGSKTEQASPDGNNHDHHPNHQHHHSKKAHMVAAFEQSLSSMTSRLQQLSSSSELKDCELERLRQTIESFKRQTTMVSSSKSSNHRSLSLTPNIKISSKKGNQTSESDHDESTTSKQQQQHSTLSCRTQNRNRHDELHCNNKNKNKSNKSRQPDSSSSCSGCTQVLPGGGGGSGSLVGDTGGATVVANGGSGNSLLIRRHTFNQLLINQNHRFTCATTSAVSATATAANDPSVFTGKFQRNLSTESVDSFASCGDILSSGKGKSKKSKIKLNGGQTNSGSGSSDGGRQTSWIRSSFSRAFKKNKSASGSSSVTGSPIKSNTIGGAGSAANRELSDAESNSLAETGCDASNSRSVPSSPLMSIRSFRSSNSTDSSSKGEPESIEELRIQLRQKEMQLTDMRLESLTSAHQLENLKEMVNQMRIELSSLRQDNDRLQRLANTKSLASSQSSMISAIGSHGSSTVPSLTAANNPNNHGKHQNNQLMEESNSLESIEMDVSISNSDCSSLKMVTLGSGSHTLASLVISPKTNWEQMDSIVRKHFKDHLIRVDLNLSLGITVDSLACYLVGDENIRRNLSDIDAMADNQTPELLPFGYLVSQSHINLQFKSALDSLAFDTLTPKSVLDHFIRLLNESRRLILSGSSGTGKTYLAHKLAEYFAVKHLTSSSSTISTHQQPPITNTNNNNNDNNNIVENSLPMSGMMIRPGAIATFNVDHKNAKELRAYLSNIAEQCESNISLESTQSLQQRHLPTVIILDNLHHIDSLMEIFNDLHKIHQPNCPYIIGTINQTITKHNIGSFEQYNFRWAILSNTTEPVSGFLGRFLRRKFLETEAKHNSLSNNTKLQNCEMGKIVEWIPKVCRYLNKYLGNYFPNDTVSIGPRLFTSCPIDVNGSQIWFTDLWNFSILPFLLENLREYWNKQNKEQRRIPEVSIVDPTEWIVENYPWQSSLEWSDHLNRLRIEDIVSVSGDCTGAVGGGLSLDSSKQQSNTLNNNSTNHTDPTQQTAAEHHGSNQDIDINKVNDPFLQMLLKLKEASEYSSQPDGNNNNNNNNCNNK